MHTDNFNYMVSVCMITYNQQAYIRDAIKGVLKQQSKFPIEFLISNDKSTDSTSEIIKSCTKDLPSNISLKFYDHDDNLGMIPNFVFALQHCKGKYIALCEGDDYWIDPLKLQKQVDFLEANQKYNICFHKVKILEGEKFKQDPVESRYEAIKKIPVTQEDLLEQGNFMHTPSVIFRNQIKEFPFEFYHSTVGDYFLHLINSKNGYIHRIDEVMAVYRKGVGVYSSLDQVQMKLKILIYQSCLLSYLDQDQQKEIILKKQLHTIGSLQKSFQKQILSFSYLSKKLTFGDILTLLKLKIKNKFKK